jgi:cytochrome b561
MTTTASTTYDSKTRALHWGSAVLVLALWLAGEFLDVFPKGPPRITARSLHICCGLFLGILLAYRIWWRKHGGVQLPAPTGFKYAQQAHMAHQLLYAVIALMLATGIALEWIRGDNLFNLFTVPAFDPGNKELRHNAKELHGWIANGLMLGASLHALMALWHQFIFKDGLLLRMLSVRSPVIEKVSR